MPTSTSTQTLYRHIFRRALEISWKNKALWFFGLFAVLIGNRGVYDLLVRNFDVWERRNTFLSFLDQIQTFLMQAFSFGGIKYFFTGDLGATMAKILTLFALLLIIGLAIWLVIVSQSALIKGSAALAKDKEFTLKDGFAAGNHFWGKIFGLNLLGELVVIALLLILGLPILLLIEPASNVALQVFLYLLSFLIIMPLIIIMSFLIIYASCYIVLKNYGIGQSITASFDLFICNWLISLEAALFLFLITTFAGLAFVILAIFVAFPILALFLVFFFLGLPVAYVSVATLGIILITLLFVMFGSLLASFQYSSWTLLFIRLTEKNATSKIVRFFRGIGKYFNK